MKKFSELTADELFILGEYFFAALEDFATQHQVNALTLEGSHNVYKAIDKAILEEWRKAKLWEM